MALNPLVSLFGRLVARSGRKCGNRRTDGRNDKPSTITLTAHARRGLITTFPFPVPVTLCTTVPQTAKNSLCAFLTSATTWKLHWPVLASTLSYANIISNINKIVTQTLQKSRFCFFVFVNFSAIAVLFPLVEQSFLWRCRDLSVHEKQGIEETRDVNHYNNPIRPHCFACFEYTKNFVPQQRCRDEVIVIIDLPSPFSVIFHEHPYIPLHFIEMVFPH